MPSREIGGKVGQNYRSCYMFDQFYPRFLWMAWSPVFDLFLRKPPQKPVKRESSGHSGPRRPKSPKRVPKELAQPFCWTKFLKKVAKFKTKFGSKFAPKFAPKFVPKFFVLSWQVEKSSPKIHQIFPIGNFKFQIEFQIKFHQKFHKHTSAGLAAPKKSPKMTLFDSSFDSFRALFGLFGPLGPEGPGDSLLTRFWLFWGFGPEGPKGLCSWRGLSQT